MPKNLSIESRIAANTLRRLALSQNEAVAEQARKTLEDPVLFARYLAMRTAKTKQRLAVVG